MTDTLMVTQEDPDQVTTTPTAARALGRAAIWVVAAVVVTLVAIVIVSGIRGGLNGGIPYAADNPAPGGSMAVVEVLRDQGVKVVATSDLDSTVLEADDDATILLSDPDLLLDEDQHARLLSSGADLVVVEPSLFELEDLAPGVNGAGAMSGTFDADCAVDAVRKAGTISGDGLGYRPADDSSATGCLADGDRFGLVRAGDVTLLGLGSVLTNEQVAADGNAALVFNLLGAHHKLVWYLPTVDDLDGQVPPNIADLTPPWVTPLAVMFILVALGAVFWRSRRLGPLVVENLPVVVRSSETMRGRARLYERGNARLHALDALRIGAVSRLARSCGLSRLASVGEVVDAVAAVTGRDRAEVAGILVDRTPQTDAELVQLSDDLLTLEAQTAAGTRR